MAATNAQSQSLPQTSLYVGDLHPYVTESTLYGAFSAAGHVLSARVCRDVALHTSLGYGYVNFENPKDAERAMELLNYEDLMGRQIRIMWCQRDPSLRKSGRGNIFIKNLDKSIAQKDLYDTFCHFGKILSCKIASDETGASKGYGFIHFQDKEYADAAIEAVNGKMINERIVFVGPFVPRGERESAGGKRKFTNCYVKGFGEDLTDEGLRQLFAEFGEIKSACIMRDKEGKSKLFGFVCFAAPESAQAAVQAIHGKDWNGHTLYANRAQSKSERQEILRQQFEKQRAERMSKYAAGINLYVKNLDDSIDDARLKDAFSRFGKITSAKVMTDGNGHSKGFGFVCFTTPEEAKDAVNMNGNLLGSKPLYVALAQRKEDRRNKLLAEHQQRLQYRTNVGSVPAAHSMANIFGPPNFSQNQRLFHASQLASQPRWNRTGLAPQQVHLGTMNPATGLRPAIQAQYMGGANAMAAMTQSQLAQANIVPQQFRNQAAAARNLVSGVQGMNASQMPNTNLIAPGAGGPQQYNGQRINLSQQMIGSAGQSVPRASMAAVAAAATRPALGTQVHRQIMQSGAPGGPQTAVRYHSSARNVSQPQQTLRPQQRPPVVGDHHQHQPMSNLAELTELEQKQYLGEKIFRKIEKTHPDLAGKITGMLIGMETSELIKMCESDEVLRTKVQEGINVLKKRDEVNSMALESNMNATGQAGDSAKIVHNENTTTERS